MSSRRLLSAPIAALSLPLSFFLLVSWLDGLVIGSALAQEKQPQPLPADIVAAWQKEGAVPGWMGPNEVGYVVFRAGEKGKAGEVPAFEFRPETRIPGQLPAPQQPFGLRLFATKDTDAGLKKLAGLKQLHSLDLS